MRPIIAAIAAAALSVGLATFAPKAEAHVSIGIGIAVPGVAVVAPVPAPFVVAPGPYYYGAPYYPPYVAVGPAFGWRAHYWGRPYGYHRHWR
jgi:hypothetical protein